LARDWLAGFRVPLRSLDALHLAFASQAGAKLVTADRELAKAARALGVATRLLVAA
jgi:predicted nucleic acid-binding protein